MNRFFPPTSFGVEELTPTRGVIMVGRAAFRDSGGRLSFDCRRSDEGSL